MHLKTASIAVTSASAGPRSILIYSDVPPSDEQLRAILAEEPDPSGVLSDGKVTVSTKVVKMYILGAS